MSEPIRFDFDARTIQDFEHLLERGALNLEPGFQRDSVWTPSDRRKLIESILLNYPVPSVFLYRREEDGRPVYDVLDGKQRLESIFMFMRARGFTREGFDVKVKLEGDEDPEWRDWATLRRKNFAARFLSYKLQTVEVSGEFDDIVNLFVRINSTGKALTGAEKRKARHFKSAFLKEAQRLARREGRYFLERRVLRPAQITRMKDVELICELLASMAGGGLINKKSAIDRAIGNKELPASSLRRASRELVSAINAVKRVFPNLASTRFRNTSEFYTLVMLVWRLQRDRLVLSDRHRNRIAERLLVRMSNGVDEVLQMQRRIQGAPRTHTLYAEYLMTVRSATDNLSQRKHREEILHGIFAGLLEKKDERRLFGPELRRLLWNSAEKKVCSQCQRSLTWSNFQADHIRAHSRGGRTELSNAGLICRSCNPSKGARRRARKAA